MKTYKEWIESDPPIWPMFVILSTLGSIVIGIAYKSILIALAFLTVTIMVIVLWVQLYDWMDKTK